MVAVRGIRFPFGRSSTELPATVVDEDVVGDSILRLMGLGRSERRMRPELEGGIYDLVWENTGPLLKARIADRVKKIIGAGEPRAQVLFVDAQEEQTKSGVLVKVYVTYRTSLGDSTVRRTFSKVSP